MTLPSTIINIRLVYYTFLISGLMLGILIIFPNLDIYFSGMFYEHNQGFVYYNNGVVRFLFSLIPILTKILFCVSLANILYCAIKYRTLKHIILSWSFYIVITVAVGPGLIVNYILKENIGRARPVQIKNFGGDKEFSQALILSNQCVNNCSFSSGHAAMGYYFTVLAYIFSPVYFSRIYLFMLFFGSFVGLSRILMGGHFLSDVVASCFIIVVMNHLLYIWWRRMLVRV